jgi:hypothetical protein
MRSYGTYVLIVAIKNRLAYYRQYTTTVGSIGEHDTVQTIRYITGVSALTTGFCQVAGAVCHPSIDLTMGCKTAQKQPAQ